ncbi:ATP-binding cassette domain-containing protein [Pontibacter diazotrophicus]|uniref:ATP-binding cassette domain-containing protein n=1 Tax=Pontibacter diazotrophicus TaxID=1400979 RepID=A0A3D8KZQ5_9BACT|nr:ATP-binding cassette domain-containing protein [Pontibacter diazotrophicus]RDV10679.1 ATP-binding cassette domain-containing protein [Pontibacter diazotrophicus]
MSDVILSFENIAVRSQGQTVLNNTTFEIKKGEHWVLIGDNETGKHLLLDAIAGNVPIVSGKAHFGFFEQYQQENPAQSPRFLWQKPVSFVSSRHSFSSLSGKETFFYQQRYNAAYAVDAPTVQQHLSEIIPFADSPFWTLDRVVVALRLQHLLDKELIKLSNGETKRVLLAAALLRNPSVLLLDNPLSGLDVESRQSFNQLITAITNSGITIVMITSPDEIPDAITHVAIWNKGKEVNTMLKNELSIGEQKSVQPVALDKADLTSLLSATATPSFEVIVKMENVSIKYGDKTVLDNISWEVKQGEKWALVGHNGAGKSTLLSLINGDNPQAYANNITLFDRRRGSGESIWDIKRNIGFVSPELFQYFPGGQSCRDVIESGFYDSLGLFQESDAAKQAIALRWMEMFKIEAFAAKPFSSVTATTQRLCLLARALVKNPPLLILDEPCHGFNAGQQRHFKSLINAICEAGNMTLIYVSHYQHEIPECVTKVIQLENGRCVSPALA